MAMNKLAQKLIHDLRFDAHTRGHFSISSWSGKNSCGTVGCIAGTAIMRAVPKAVLVNQNVLWSVGDVPGFDPDEWGYSHDSLGSYILGLPSRRVGAQLFLPWEKWISPLLESGGAARFITDLSHNERPSLDTIGKMVMWANALPSNAYHPTHCANALENLLTKERQYVDWAEAWCEA